jgi:O-antigen ligase
MKKHLHPTAPYVEMLILASVLVIAVLWNSLEPTTALIPKLVGVISFFLLVAFLARYASSWLLALLVVGQTFFKAGLNFLGGVSRNTPISPSLITVGVVLALVFVMRPSRREAKLLHFVGLNHPVSKTIFISAIILAVILFLNLPRSLLYDYGKIKVLGYIVYNIAPMFMVLIFLKQYEDVRQLALAFAVFGTLTAIATCIYLWVTYGSIFGWGGLLRFDTVNFIGLGVYGGVWMARRAGVAAISAAALFYLSKKWHHSLLALIIVAFNWFAIFLTGRGPFVTFTIVLLMFLGMVKTSSFLNRVWRSLILILPAVLILVGAITTSALQLPEDLLKAYNIREWNSNQNPYRIHFYASAWEVFLKNPLAGVGTGGWRAYYSGPDQKDVNVYPHNIVLELAAENGLVGLIPFLVMIATSFWAAIHLYRRSSADSETMVWSLWALSLFMVSFANAMISGDIYRNDFLWVSAGIVGALDAIEREQETKSGVRPKSETIAIKTKRRA